MQINRVAPGWIGIGPWPASGRVAGSFESEGFGTAGAEEDRPIPDFRESGKQDHPPRDWSGPGVRAGSGSPLADAALLDCRLCGTIPARPNQPDRRTWVIGSSCQDGHASGQHGTIMGAWLVDDRRIHTRYGLTGGRTGHGAPSQNQTAQESHCARRWSRWRSKTLKRVSKSTFSASSTTE